MRITLVVQGGQLDGRALVIHRLPFVIGRTEDCHLRTASPLISKRHAEILARDGRLLVRDLGSRNGTLVNGERVTGEAQLLDGSTLEIGPLNFLVRLTGAAPKGPPFDLSNMPPPSDEPTKEGPVLGEDDTATDAPAPPPGQKPAPKPKPADTAKLAGGLLRSMIRRPRDEEQ
jgi:pSer/pThr/pTyr-binding forkhead associated (FHA) protein